MAARQQMKAGAYSLKPGEVRRLALAAVSFRDRCIINALYWLGLRRAELVSLDIRDIDFDRARVTVREGKGGKTRVVPVVHAELLGDLRHLTGARRTGPVFLSNNRKALSLRLVNHVVQRLGELAGVVNPTPR